MAALPRNFSPDVTDIIMRFAVGYPRDRVRGMMATVKRKEKPKGEDVVVSWRPYRGAKQIKMRLILGVVATSHAWLDSDQEIKVDDLAFTCDACEPAELQLERTHF